MPTPHPDIEGVDIITLEEGIDIVNNLTMKGLGLSAKEFVKRVQAGEFRDCEYARYTIMLPAMGYTSDGIWQYEPDEAPF